MDIRDARELVCGSGRRLLAEGLAAGTWGNVSCRVDESRMVITPSGADYESLRPEDMVLMDFRELRGEEGKKPSSEYALHALIYRDKPGIFGVVHHHGLYAGIVSVTAAELPAYLEDMAMILGPSVKVAAHGPAGSLALAQGAVAALGDNYAVILQNHGALCLGRDMEEAFAACHILERACQTFVTVRLLGGGRPLPLEECLALREKYLNVYRSGTGLR